MKKRLHDTENQSMMTLVFPWNMLWTSNMMTSMAEERISGDDDLLEAMED